MSDTTVTFDTKKNRYHTELSFFKKTMHYFDTATTPNMSPGSFYLIFIDDFVIGFIATTYFW